MKVIDTTQYVKFIMAQVTYDPDNPDEPLNVYDTEVFDIEDPDELIGEENILPVVTPEDAMSEMEDGITEEPIELEPIEEPEEYPEFPSSFQALRWAKQNNEVVRIEYSCESGIFITRDVEPHGDFFARTTSRRILVTYDETIGDIRAFIVRNIQGYTFTGNKFEPKFNFSVTRRNYRRKARQKQKRRLRLLKKEMK